MTDRELLELAAKAAGLDAGPKYDDHDGLQIDADIPIGYRWWNPLADDGDAFRLMVKIAATVKQFVGSVIVAAMGPGVQIIEIREVYADHGDDWAAATRRAIVRAAAAMAEKKPAPGGSSEAG